MPLSNCNLSNVKIHGVNTCQNSCAFRHTLLSINLINYLHIVLPYDFITIFQMYFSHENLIFYDSYRLTYGNGDKKMQKFHRCNNQIVTTFLQLIQTHSSTCPLLIRISLNHYFTTTFLFVSHTHAHEHTSID